MCALSLTCATQSVRALSYDAIRQMAPMCCTALTTCMCSGIPCAARCRHAMHACCTTPNAVLQVYGPCGGSQNPQAAMEDLLEGRPCRSDEYRRAPPATQASAGQAVAAAAAGGGVMGGGSG